MFNKTELDTVFLQKHAIAVSSMIPKSFWFPIKTTSQICATRSKHHILYAFNCIFREITSFASKRPRIHSLQISVSNLIPWQSRHLSDHSCGYDCKCSVCGQTKTQTGSKKLYKNDPTRATLHAVPIKLAYCFHGYGCLSMSKLYQAS